MVEEKPTTERAKIRIEIDLDQLIAAACALPAEARQKLRDALDTIVDEEEEWLEGMLTSEGNPVLAELWDNPDDAVYDNL